MPLPVLPKFTLIHCNGVTTVDDTTNHWQWSINTSESVEGWMVTCHEGGQLMESLTRFCRTRAQAFAHIEKWLGI